MDFSIFENSYLYFSLLSNITIFKWFFVFCLTYLIWRLFIYIYAIAISPSGIHYVNWKRNSVPMAASYNPFSFEANCTSANYSGIKCILKSEQSCYVQAYWGVPISSLFELLHGDWQSLVTAVITDIPAQQFSRKCVCANDPFILAAGEEKSVEFKPHWQTSESALSQEAKFVRKKYPFVVLMVLEEKNKISESSVIAMTSAIHVPDKYLLLCPQLLGQYIKLASGHIGQIKKIFLSSPASSDDGGDKYDLCLACYHRPVSTVFLPCRHACLCSVCFDLCEKCPVCRAASLYYFELPDVHGGSNH